MKIRILTVALAIVVLWSETDVAAADGAIVTLPPLEVRGERITDFGMSVRTNFGVVLGRKVKWMRVGAVVPGSAAAIARLNPDDQVLLINRVRIIDLKRDDMLRHLSGRSAGDRLSLAIREAKTRRFRWVELKASPIGKRN